MFITIAVIAYNEENTIGEILNDISMQDYAHSSMEIILVDSASTDNTRLVMEKFARENTMGAADIRVLDNPKKTLPCGWNVLLDNYKGDAVIRVDAHAHIPQDFVRKNVEILEQGEMIVGGQRPNIVDEETAWKDTLLLAESSMFGSSIAPYRNGNGASGEKIYMKSLFHAAYRREVFEKIGHYNEALTRTEDNEIHYRMRKAGYKLRFCPDIISYQHTRNSLPRMLKQKYANGYWIGKTSKVCPQCLSLYHFVPWAFVVAVIVTTAASIGCKIFAVKSLLSRIIYGITGLMWGAYWLLAVVMAVVASVGAGKKRNITCFLLPFLFFLLHISYGIGTVCGLAGKKPAKE